MSTGPMYDDRREGEERRDADQEAEGMDKRAPERRQSTDRRGWPFGLILRTSESYHAVEDWLEENCIGKWGLGLEDMDEALALKSFKIMFEEEIDKKNFVDNFSRH